jgi:conjugative transfer signal peptidase TraF
MPRRLYWLDLWRTHPPRRGAIVAVCLPRNAACLAARRGYIGPGECACNTSPVLKRIAALSPDLVEVRESGILVNGAPLPHSGRRARDSRARLIPRVPAGLYPLKPATAWLYGESDARSWDSRYFGPVPLAGLVAEAHPIPWTWVFTLAALTGGAFWFLGRRSPRA